MVTKPTSGPDRINGTAKADKIDGLAGADIINGLAGNDILSGGLGKDQLSGGLGADVLTGGIGADILNGGKGFDTASYLQSKLGIKLDLRKTTGQIGGDAQGDKLSGIENVVGSNFIDTIYGTSKSNIITGGKGADKLYGLGGSDTVSYATSSKGVTIELADTKQTSTGDANGDQLFSFENILGSKTADTLHGNAGANRINGGAGNDIIGGNLFFPDPLISTAKDNDTLTGGAGGDTFEFNQHFGKDKITDFKAGASSGDTIFFADFYNFNTIDELIASGKQVGADVVFTLGDSTLTLQHVQKSALIADDFIFAA